MADQNGDQENIQYMQILSGWTFLERLTPESPDVPVLQEFALQEESLLRHVQATLLQRWWLFVQKMVTWVLWNPKNVKQRGKKNQLKIQHQIISKHQVVTGIL